MSSSQNHPPKPLPLPWKIAGSAFALFHLGAVGLLALAAQAGPMNPKYVHPTFGAMKAQGPTFATKITAVTKPYYLTPLCMWRDYHFESNRPLEVGCFFEVQLKNELGDVVKTLKFPDDNASAAVRHRQEMLARGLAADEPPLARGTQKIAAPGQAPKQVEVWEPDKEGTLHTKLMDESEAQEKQLFRPAVSSKVLAQSYLRYLCRRDKAASAVLYRYAQPQAIPSYLIEKNPLPPQLFAVTKSEFGEYRRE
jgi:hypothetical protein